MKVELQKIPDREKELVVIQYAEYRQEIEELYSYALTKGKELSGYSGDALCRFKLEDVLYFEAVDERVFACTSEHVYELKCRLYELEQAFHSHFFMRCSKSVVINLMQLDSISPSLNGRFLAHLKNRETVMISRQYVPLLKKCMTGDLEYGK